MPLRSIVFGLLAAVALATSARAAEANLSNFKPANGADGIIATEGARPWESAAPFDVKFWLDWAQRPVARPGGGAVMENRTGGWFTADLHVLEPLSLGIAVPYTIHEHGTLTLQPKAGTRIQDGTGLGDIRITPRLGLARQETAGVDFAVQATIELPSSDAGLLTTWGTPVAEALVSVGRRFSGITAGTGLSVIGNLYGFTAPNRTLIAQNIGAGFGARVGAVYETGRHNAMPSRVYAEWEAKSMPRLAIDEGPTPAEWRGGLSWCFGPGFVLDLAAGSGMNTAPGSPSFRVVSALGFGANSCSARASKAAAEKAAAAKAAADKAAADKAAADKAAADKAAADKAAADKAAADARAAEEKAAADRAAAEKAAADKAAADKAAAEAAAAAAKKDTDGDGVPDSEDNCPNEAGPASNHGCPASKKQLVAVTREGIQIMDKVQFAPGKAAIAKASFPLLDQVAAVLKTHADLDHVEVQGHTDSSGDAKKNTALSQSRAEAVVKYLANKGIDAKRLVAKGYGPTVPIADNATKDGREKNRRVEFKVVH